MTTQAYVFPCLYDLVALYNHGAARALPSGLTAEAFASRCLQHAWPHTVRPTVVAEEALGSYLPVVAYTACVRTKYTRLRR